MVVYEYLSKVQKDLELVARLKSDVKKMEDALHMLDGKYIGQVHPAKVSIEIICDTGDFQGDKAYVNDTVQRTIPIEISGVVPVDLNGSFKVTLENLLVRSLAETRKKIADIEGKYV